LLISTIVPGINYSVVITHPLHQLQELNLYALHTNAVIRMLLIADNDLVNAILVLQYFFDLFYMLVESCSYVLR